MPPSRPSRARPTLSSLALLLLGIAGFVALWSMLSLSTGRQHGWMAVLGALDVVLMLRLGRWPAGPGRVLAALAGTAAVVVASNWLVIAGQLGRMLGLTPLQSALKLGSHHAWTLAQLANGTLEIVMAALALLVAALASR
ncbi:hypothetical protein [Novilysobacter defluvii]|uniref:Membrane protein n=1 Tax=Lysobacter defluvii IMMIB APB-9 = DSM 18482 TaxID=1385515 RepID=A0A0A0M407_9GAMM|nr:hypothetical protein [Lysobacter defluvii]KGO97748.1 membrane protein [Lysobacter defluvii IMMIB APB-9 = DSM 18482]